MTVFEWILEFWSHAHISFFLSFFLPCAAYYLDFQNRRPDFITTFFELINWDKVAERFAAAK